MAHLPKFAQLKSGAAGATEDILNADPSRTAATAAAITAAVRVSIAAAGETDTMRWGAPSVAAYTALEISAASVEESPPPALEAGAGLDAGALGAPGVLGLSELRKKRPMKEVISAIIHSTPTTSTKPIIMNSKVSATSG